MKKAIEIEIPDGYEEKVINTENGIKIKFEKPEEKHLVIFGEIEFYCGDSYPKLKSDTKAIINRIDCFKFLTYEEALEQMDHDKHKGEYFGFVIPSIYQGEIEYKETWKCLNNDTLKYVRTIDYKHFAFHETVNGKYLIRHINLSDYTVDDVFLALGKCGHEVSINHLKDFVTGDNNLFFAECIFDSNK